MPASIEDLAGQLPTMSSSEVEQALDYLNSHPPNKTPNIGPYEVLGLTKEGKFLYCVEVTPEIVLEMSTPPEYRRYVRGLIARNRGMLQREMETRHFQDPYKEKILISAIESSIASLEAELEKARLAEASRLAA